MLYFFCLPYDRLYCVCGLHRIATSSRVISVWMIPTIYLEGRHICLHEGFQTGLRQVHRLIVRWAPTPTIWCQQDQPLHVLSWYSRLQFCLVVTAGVSFNWHWQWTWIMASPGDCSIWILPFNCNFWSLTSAGAANAVRVWTLNSAKENHLYEPLEVKKIYVHSFTFGSKQIKVLHSMNIGHISTNVQCDVAYYRYCK